MRRWFENLAIGPKLGAAFAVLLLTSFAPAAFGLAAMSELHHVAGEIQETWFPKARHIADINHEISAYRILQLRHMIATDGPEMDAYERAMADAMARFAAAERAYLPLVASHEERAVYDGFKSSLSAYLAETGEALRLSRTNAADSIQLAFARTSARFDPMNEQLERLVTYNVRSADVAVRGARQAFATAQRMAWIAMLVALGTALALALYMNRSIADPLERLTHLADDLATEGRLAIALPTDVIDPNSRDQVRRLSGSFARLVTTLSSLARHATLISEGDLSNRIETKGDLPEAFERMKDRISSLTDQLDRVGTAIAVEGRVDVKADVAGASGAWKVLVDTVNRLADGLVRQLRSKSELARFAQLLQGQRDLKTAGEAVLSNLATSIGIQVGLIYLRTDEADDSVFALKASYAHTQRKHIGNRFRPGEGLVGQCALEGKAILLSDVPDDYIVIRSGLGERVPSHILVVPIRFENVTLGVLELGSLAALEHDAIAFVEQVAESLGIAFHTIATSLRTERLLEESQTLTEELTAQHEELQTQQEELREKNSTLEAHTRRLQESDLLMRRQQDELQQANEELEEKSQQLLERNASVEATARELEAAKLDLEEKARQLALTSQYKSQFLANMSHELRTPLNSLLILSRMLADNKEGTLTPKQVGLAQTVHGAGTDLLSLINEILDLAKIESGTVSLDIEELRLEDLRRSSDAMFRPIAQSKGVAFSIDVDPHLPTSIRTDPRRLQQVVKNLLSNAFKFTERGSVSLRMALEATKTDDPNTRGSIISLTVVDTGIGIPEEKQALVFEAFQQADAGTSRKYGGTGLGLAICKEIVRLLGGTIELTSVAGSGSTFAVRIPLQYTAVAEPLVPESVTRQAPRASLRPNGIRDEPTRSQGEAPISLHRDLGFEDDRLAIRPDDRVLLAIEDDLRFARILLDLAREKGWKGLVATRGADALSLLSQYAVTAITLDLRLPDADGWTLLDRIKRTAATRHIPVHVISVDADKSLGRKLGAYAALKKPVTKEALDDLFANMGSFAERGAKRLLVVEDDEASRKSVVELIGDEGVETTAVATGAEALAALRAQRFDCMVLDLSLPDMSGFQLLDAIHRELGIDDLPVVVNTARDLTKKEEADLAMITDAVVVKDGRSPERLLAETALFLHRVDTTLPLPKRKLLEKARITDPVLAGKKILIVDDDLRNIVALTALLESHLVEVQYAESGTDALELLGQNGEMSLVLMDIMMPEMDGYETTRRIRANPKFASLPVIALTAKAMRDDRQKCLDAGASDYISKPVDQEQLLSLLRVWCSR